MQDKWVFVIFMAVLHFSFSERVKHDAASTMPSLQDQDRLADAVNNFGYTLTKQIVKMSPNNNAIISPTGIAGLLAMTLLGSIGGTYDELARTLGFSQDILTNRRNHEQFGELLKLLTSDTTSTTLYADAIFVDGQSQIRPVYRDYLERIYRGEALSAQFGNFTETKDIINDWVKNRTNGKIDNFLDKPLPTNTKVVLLSALYFSGQWAQPFVPAHTKNMTFKTNLGEIMTALMLNGGQFKYQKSVQDGVHIIALPYNDSITTMYVIKPLFPKHLNLQDMIDQLNNEKINRLIEGMANRECVIRFPKMELKSKINLEDYLKSLGVVSAFSPMEANFALMIDSNSAVSRKEEELITRINNQEVEDRGLKDLVNRLPNPGVHIDTVLHDVKLSINEYGTEAVAATGAILARSAELFYADSPFYMFIRNERTKLVTFSAAIFNPTT